MNIENWIVAVHTDLYHAGTTEDGEAYHAECYCVIAERKDGKRLAHFRTFEGCVVHHSENGEIGFEDVRKEAFADACKLSMRVEVYRVINLNYWHEVSPVYGSEYYCKVNRF